MDTDATLERLINTDARRWAWLNDPEFHARVVVLVTAGTPTELVDLVLDDLAVAAGVRSAERAARLA